MPIDAHVHRFRRLHESGCFVLPNPWDAGSAVYLHRLGFRALATTSAGAAFARGLPDAVGAMSLDAVLDHVREIVQATPLPVNADFQEGYAREPEGVAANVARCVRTGAGGLSIEDGSGDPPAGASAAGAGVQPAAIRATSAAVAARRVNAPP